MYFSVDCLLDGYELWVIQVVQQRLSKPNTITSRKSFNSALESELVLLVSSK